MLCHLMAWPYRPGRATRTRKRSTRLAYLHVYLNELYRGLLSDIGCTCKWSCRCRPLIVKWVVWHAGIHDIASFICTPSLYRNSSKNADRCQFPHGIHGLDLHVHVHLHTVLVHDRVIQLKVWCQRWWRNL